MTRTKQRARRGRGRIDKRRRSSTGTIGTGGEGKGRGESRGEGRGEGARRSRPTAEQLDYDMELLRAQREGREDTFRKEHAEKRREKRKQTLDEEMDEYFRKRNEDDPAEAADLSPSTENGGTVKDDAKIGANAEKQKNGKPAVAAENGK